MQKEGRVRVKIRIEVQSELKEDEVIIRCSEVDDTVRNIQRLIREQAAPGEGIVFYQGNREFYFPLGDVMFFETEGETVYAHTADDCFRVKHRLYELEGMLPGRFVRISKSAIINITHILAITRNLTASSRVEFRNSCKHIYASRHYYTALKERLQERSKYEK